MPESSNVSAVLDGAVAGGGALATSPPRARADMLRALASALNDQRESLIALGVEETGLSSDRLSGEMDRTVAQLRLFADAVVEGSMFEVAVDTADGESKPPRPDVRRHLVPVGPVLVFAASNFPFAFSVMGGDTASALAAGCAVVVKAHPGHAQLSQATLDVARTALGRSGFDGRVLSIIWGRDAGVAALRDPRIRAAAFTGSAAGGGALLEVANSRPDPIPFYGELGSLNPVVVTRGALEARAREIVDGFVQSFTLSMGQFCTKPGLLFLPEGHGMDDALLEAMAAHHRPGGRMLTPRIRDAFVEGVEELARLRGVSRLVSERSSLVGESETSSPVLLSITAADFLQAEERILEECFGPVSIICTYGSDADLLAALERLRGHLVSAIHGEPGERELSGQLVALLASKAGRLVWNGWPTGVPVGWATHHGGPYPATTGSIHTSVGMTASRRFLRPVAFQSMPDELLPSTLNDANPHQLPRRINGVIAS